MESIGCMSLVNKPPRVTNHSSTVLDHIYAHAVKGEIEVGVLQMNLTDHFPLVAKMKDSTPVKIEHYCIKMKKSSNVDGEQFVIDLSLIWVTQIKVLNPCALIQC